MLKSLLLSYFVMKENKMEPGTSLVGGFRGFPCKNFVSDLSSSVVNCIEVLYHATWSMRIEKKERLQGTRD